MWNILFPYLTLRPFKSECTRSSYLSLPPSSFSSVPRLLVYTTAGDTGILAGWRSFSPSPCLETHFRPSGCGRVCYICARSPAPRLYLLSYYFPFLFFFFVTFLLSREIIYLFIHEFRVCGSRALVKCRWILFRNVCASIMFVGMLSAIRTAVSQCERSRLIDVINECNVRSFLNEEYTYTLRWMKHE